MRILVIGYGRLGRQLVKRLDTRKHEVTVVDKERSLLEHPDRDPNARFLVGNAIDEVILREAGVDRAEVLFALTRDENTNLMVAQVARLIYGVPRVVAVVYDPKREQAYHRAGIETLALTVTGAELLASQMVESPEKPITLEEAQQRARGHAAEAGAAVAPSPQRMEEARPFYVIIVGGGRVGYYLARSLLENNLEVTVIESDPEIYALVSQQVDCPVIRGDGSSTAILEQAGAARCNVFVAVTNHDHDNLIACQIAKQRFGVPKTIARVKNPRNEVIMQRLGVDITVSSTAIITSVIQSELPTTRIRTVLDLRAGQLELMEYSLDSKSPVVGKRLRDLEIPADCNIVTILRNGDAIIPRGDTTFENKDVVLTLVRISSEPQIRKFILG